MSKHTSSILRFTDIARSLARHVPGQAAAPRLGRWIPAAARRLWPSECAWSQCGWHEELGARACARRDFFGPKASGMLPGRLKCIPLGTCQRFRPGGRCAPFCTAGRALFSRRRSLSSSRAPRRYPSRVARAPVHSLARASGSNCDRRSARRARRACRACTPRRPRAHRASSRGCAPSCPRGARSIDSIGSPVGLAHVLRRGDSLPALADAYVDLTDIYLARELSKAIQKENPNFRAASPTPGERLSSSPPS